MMRATFYTIIICLLATPSVAHGGVKSWIIDGKEYDGFHPYESPEGQVTIGRPWATVDPILSANDQMLACNNDGRAMPGHGQISAPIRAGQSILAVWGYWIHPFGPGTVYMARCPGSCSAANSSALAWFKIEHTGLVSGNILEGKWASGLVVDTGLYNATIPASLASGEYLIRNELIALHAAAAFGAQFYAECAQLVVTGGEGKLPPSQYLVKFPGAYTSGDPGLTVDVYKPGSTNITAYDVPGPPVWNGQEDVD